MDDNKAHVNSHRITVFRFGSFLSRAQAASSDSFFEGSKESIGAYFAKGSMKVASGMNFDEEALLMPNMIDTPAEDREFRKKVTEFFNDLTTNIPFKTGMELEIGLKSDNNLPVSKENMPIDLDGYIRYRHAKAHPWVAENRESGDGNQMKKFYIFDKATMQSKKTEINKQKDAASVIYHKVKVEPKQIGQMLVLMGIDTRQWNNNKDKDNLMLEALRDISESKPIEFKKVYDEGELEIRAWIAGMVTTGVFKMIGKRFVDPEDAQVEIGNSLDEAIAFFQNEENSGAVTMYKAKYQEANLRTPVADHRKTVVA